MTLHHLSADPENLTWGAFDAAIPPRLTIESGDTVVLECLSGGADMFPPEGSPLVVPPKLIAYHQTKPRRHGAHILTGPVAVAGAEPGDTLEVRIDKIEFGSDYGFTGYRPLYGTLPEDFPEAMITHTPIDKVRNVGKLPWGPEIALAPFFGVMGVAPPPSYGMINTKEPREHGGNLDNKELGAGTSLFLPVWVPGANFSAGDGHGVQGDGEVCINALETCLTGTFTLVVHKKDQLKYPRGETATHFISMGMNEDLDLAMKQALRQMIAFICARTNLTPGQAYQFCSLQVDFRVTQTVNGEKGVHGMLRKGLLF
jgi:acetamidase/formamidase